MTGDLGVAWIHRSKTIDVDVTLQKRTSLGLQRGQQIEELLLADEVQRSWIAGSGGAGGNPKKLPWSRAADPEISVARRVFGTTKERNTCQCPGCRTTLTGGE